MSPEQKQLFLDYQADYGPSMFDRDQVTTTPEQTILDVPAPSAVSEFKSTVVDELPVASQQLPAVASRIPRRVNSKTLPVTPDQMIHLTQATQTAIKQGKDWWSFAACKDVKNYSALKADAAAKVCKFCPVIEQCLEEGFKLSDAISVRGGLTKVNLVRKYKEMALEKARVAAAKAEAFNAEKVARAAGSDLQSGL